MSCSITRFSSAACSGRAICEYAGRSRMEFSSRALSRFSTGAVPTVQAVHREEHLAGAERVGSLVSARLIGGRFQADDDAVFTRHELVGAYPLTIRAENRVVGGANELPAVLQHERDAVLFALRVPSSLQGGREPTVRRRPEHHCTAGFRELLDAAGRAVGEQD